MMSLNPYPNPGSTDKTEDDVWPGALSGFLLTFLVNVSLGSVKEGNPQGPAMNKTRFLVP